MKFKYWLENLDLMALHRHLTHPTIDIGSHAWDFLSWEGSKSVLRRLNINPVKFKQDMESGDDGFYATTELIDKSMSENEINDFLAHIGRHNPGDMPSHSLMDVQSGLGRKGYLPPTTWLIHFTEDAESVRHKGLIHGQNDMSRLALTVHQSKAEKKYGGYNFAFFADSRDAVYAARNGKYGSEAVMFQASGIPIYHQSDEEYQVILWGKDVPTDRMVMLTPNDDDWIVRNTVNGRDPFTGDFQKAVAWVINNYNQYKRIL